MYKWDDLINLTLCYTGNYGWKSAGEQNPTAWGMSPTAEVAQKSCCIQPKMTQNFFYVTIIYCSSPTGASFSHRQWMKSYSFALTLTCTDWVVTLLVMICHYIQMRTDKDEKQTLYGVGFSRRMWSGRSFSSCCMQRILIFSKEGSSALGLSAGKHRHTCHWHITRRSPGVIRTLKFTAFNDPDI